jgi:hypothetical protein
MASIRLQPIEGEKDATLLLELLTDPLLVRDVQGHQLLISLHQIGHTALGDADPTRQQSSMHLGDTTMLPETPLTDPSYHLQATFPLRERPTPFFLRPIGYMRAWTCCLDTVAHDGGQFPQTIQAGRSAHTALSRGSTRSHASHWGAAFVAPSFSSCQLFFLLLGFFASFCLQDTPASTFSFPFRGFSRTANVP